MSQASYSEAIPPRSSARSDFMGELNEAIRQNPIPAALVGVGLLWLFAGGRNVMLGGASRAVVGGTARAVQGAGGAVYRGAREVTGRVADGIRGAGELGQKAGSQVTGVVKGAADSLGSAVTQTGEAVKEVASHVTERMWSPGSDKMGGGMHEESGSQARSSFSHAQDNLADFFARQPLMLGAVGVAIGAAIAVSMRASDAENSLLGATADAVNERAGELWTETRSRGAELVSKGLEEAKAQGLTADAAGAAARNIVSKVAGLAEKAGNDILDRKAR